VTSIINYDAIATTSTDALVIHNTTASTAGVPVQYGPAYKTCGTAYNSTSTLSELDCWRIYAVPVTLAGPTSVTLNFDKSIAGGAFGNRMSLTDAGLLTVFSAITATNNDITAAGGNVIVGATNSFKWAATRSKMFSPADSQIMLQNAGATDFNRVMFGGSSSSFPSLKKESATDLSSRLADDSAYGGFVTDNDSHTSANGAIEQNGQSSELLTLSTVGLTTDTAANLLPVGAVISGVVTRITTTITTTTNYAVGDPTTSDRFCSASATLTAGSTQICNNFLNPATATTDARGSRQLAAAKVRITCTGSNPGAGIIRITVFWRKYTPPTS
jgi:predicted enzyme related to lactoylglutathione lyase